MKYFKDVFKVFLNKEAHFENLDNHEAYKFILRQIIIISIFAFIYGFVMGSYHSLLQSFVSGIKVTFLFLSTFLICFPSFYIIQLVLGSRMNFLQMIMIVLSGFILILTITLSFTPIVIFFLFTGNNYYFLQLLHVAIFVFSGIFGMKTIIELLKFACEKKDIYPKIGVTIFRVWIVIFALVSIQLAWNLRPFLSDKGENFKLFRKYKGNFYTAIIYSIGQLTSPENKIEVNNTYIALPDSIETRTIDTTEIINILEK